MAGAFTEQNNFFLSFTKIKTWTQKFNAGFTISVKVLASL